jgi:hypothetical protein
MLRTRYEPNNKSFGAMMMSDQTQDLANQGARRGVIEARRLASSLSLPERYIASIKAAEGPPKRLGRNVRRTAQVQASYVFIEFGSGQKRPRPQGGSSPAYRVLGRTASVVGSLPRGAGR